MGWRRPRKNRSARSGAQLQVALWPADQRVKPGFVASLDGEVETDVFESRGEFVRFGAHDFEIRQAAALWSIFCGMDGVSAPFDEEREETVAVVGEIDGFPVEDVAIGALTGAVVGTLEGDLIFAEQLGGGSDVRGVDGPADEARLGHSEDLREVNDLPLRRIRGDDFQIAALAQREERVASAAAGMNASECGAHARIFFNEVDAAIEIVAADNDVIEQSGHLVVIFLVCRPGDARRNNRASGQGEKKSP